MNEQEPIHISEVMPEVIDGLAAEAEELRKTGELSARLVEDMAEYAMRLQDIHKFSPREIEGAMGGIAVTAARLFVERLGK